jgi:hypothetical protein
MPREEVLTTALRRCEALILAYPQLATLRSILQQIQYLLALERGQTSNRNQLENIVIGVQAAREVEPLSDSAAESFHRVARIAEDMLREQLARGEG